MTTPMYFNDLSKSGKEGNGNHPSGYLPLGKKLLDNYYASHLFHYVIRIIHQLSWMQYSDFWVIEYSYCG